MRQLSGTKETCELLATDCLIADRTLYSTNGTPYLFPLYLYNDNMGKVERRPNFDAAIYAKICAAVNDAPCLQASANAVRNKTKDTGLSVLSYIQGESPAPFDDNKIALSAKGVNGGDVRLAFYREHELGKTWYDVADPRDFLSMEPIEILVDETADRKTVKSVFRQMNPVRNLDDGRCVSFPVAAAKKLRLLREVNVPGIAAELGRLFAMSRLAWSEMEAEIPNHKQHRNAYAYHHYIVKMSVKAGEYYVRFAVREDTSVDARNELHDAIISNIVIYKAKGAELSGPGLSRVEDSTPFVDNKIALFLSAVNGVEKREEGTGNGEQAVEPEDVFNYIYGVLHTPSYREKYREFLKIDFPRIPYPKGASEFRRIAAVGEKLVKVHLLKDEAVTNPFANPYAKFAGAGDGMVNEVRVVGEGEQRKVYVNTSQWFEPVPETAWNFYIGGYQPAQKWLKDRKGRALTNDDQQHYRAIIVALMKTAALMGELEEGRD